jgi:hypothetical protein
MPLIRDSTVIMTSNVAITGIVIMIGSVIMTGSAAMTGSVVMTGRIRSESMLSVIVAVLSTLITRQTAQTRCEPSHCILTVNLDAALLTRTATSSFSHALQPLHSAHHIAG